MDYRKVCVILKYARTETIFFYGSPTQLCRPTILFQTIFVCHDSNEFEIVTRQIDYFAILNK